MTTYTLCKTVIDHGTYASKEDMQFKLDVFLLNNRISENEYNELVDMLNSQ